MYDPIFKKLLLSLLTNSRMSKFLIKENSLINFDEFVLDKAQIRNLQKLSSDKRLKSQIYSGCCSFKGQDIQMQYNNQNMRQENQKKNMTGRWTRAQHEKFMNAIEKYGTNWFQIQKKVKTRTLPQIRSHAQKMFIYMNQADIEALSQKKTSQFSSKTKLTRQTKEKLLFPDQIFHKENFNNPDERLTESSFKREVPPKKETGDDSEQVVELQPEKPKTFCLTLPRRTSPAEEVLLPKPDIQPEPVADNFFLHALLQNFNALFSGDLMGLPKKVQNSNQCQNLTTVSKTYGLF